MASHITVTALINYIKTKMTKDALLRDVAVKGQISNFKYDPRKNYAFFSLQDSQSGVDCTYFDVENFDMNEPDIEGEEVEITGNIGIYQRTGKMQLYVEKIKRCGESEKAKQLEMLRQKLEVEGLFDKEKEAHTSICNKDRYNNGKGQCSSGRHKEGNREEKSIYKYGDRRSICTGR